MTIPPLGISVLKPIYKPKPVEETKEEVEEAKPVKKTTAKKTTTKKAETEKTPAKKATTKKKAA
jgi:hypothetical protein